MENKKIKKILALGFSMTVATYALLVVSLPIMAVLQLVAKAMLQDIPLLYSIAALLIILSPIALIVYQYQKITNQPIRDLIQNELMQSGEVFEINKESVQDDIKSEKIRQAFIKASSQLEMDVSNIVLLRSTEEMFNAFALSNRKNEGAVVVFDGIASAVDEDKLQAVIGHELGHIKNKDSLYKIAIFATQYYIPTSMAWNDRFLTGLHNFGLRFNNTWVTLTTSIIVLMFRLQAWFLVGALWLNNFVNAYAFKQSEFMADHVGSQASSKEAMINVLTMIEQLEQESDIKPSALYALLAEHPKTSSRVQYIQSI